MEIFSKRIGNFIRLCSAWFTVHCMNDVFFSSKIENLGVFFPNLFCFKCFDVGKYSLKSLPILKPKVYLLRYLHFLNLFGQL